MVRAWAWLPAIAAIGCSLPDSDYFGPVPDVDDPRHLRYCNQGEPEWIDPAMGSTTTSTKIMHTLFDGLTDYGKDGLPRPSLATRWDISEDQRRFTFHLHDRGRWSNGRPVTAHDLAYHVVRVLHPLTASPNSDLIEAIKSSVAYTGNRVRVLRRPVGPLPAGSLVDIVGVGDRTIEQIHAAGDAVPDTNVRRAHRVLRLRDLGAPASAAYARVAQDTDVTLIELTGGPVSPPSPDGQPWAYVHHNAGDGVFGWVPAAELEVEPSADVVYRVRPVPAKRVVGSDPTAPPPVGELTATGRDLIMLPEAIGIRVPDPYTFVIETADPTPFLINLTPNRALRATPREAVSRSPRRWTDVGSIVTSGPMHLVTWKPRDYLELMRSPTYWDQERVKLDRMTVFSMENQAASANYYYAGGCDATTSNHIPASYLPVLSGEKRDGRRYRDFHTAAYLGIYKIIINTKRHPNRHLRRALAYAIDRTVIPTFLHGGQIPTSSYVPGKPIAQLTPEERALCGVGATDKGVALIMTAGELCYVPPLGLDFDPDKARAELAIARRELGAAFPSLITYKFNVGNEGHKLIGEYLQVQWQKVLGIPVQLETQEWKVFVSDTKNGNFDVARMGWIGNFEDPEAEFLSLWRCSSPNNRPQWCDPRYEEAMEAAKPLRDRQARNAKIAEAEQIVLDEAPIIPLYVYTQSHLQKPYVRDLAINVVDLPPLFEAWRDPDWRADPGPRAEGAR
jgi:oligopeptide transport system substrate-binding protein